MHDNPIRGRAVEPLGREAEGAVLCRVLELHPAHLGERELALDLVGDILAPRCETYEEAIEKLVKIGLLRRDGGSIRPTDAALRAEEIKR